MNQQRKAQIANLANNYGRQVFRSAYRLLSDVHLAEDVTQDVFIKLFKKSTESFDTIQNWPGYLKSMAISTAIDHIRKHTRLSEESFDNIPEKHAQISAEPLQQMLQDRDLTTFKNALMNLSTQDAHLFCLRHIEGYSYQEISECIGISSNQVGVSLHRSQTKLSNILGESQSLGESHGN